VTPLPQAFPPTICHSRASGNPRWLSSERGTLGPRFRGDDNLILLDEKWHPLSGLQRRALKMRGPVMKKTEDNSAKISGIAAALDWAYDKAVNGIPKLDRAEDLAEDYLKRSSSSEEAIENLIAWQIGKAGVAGFVTGLGGIVTLPVAVPANLASVLWIQIRMVAAIAHIRGFDIRSDQVRALVLACLAGSSTNDILKDVGINVGSKLGKQAITRIPSVMLRKINQTVGFRLVTKAGSSGAVNLSKIIPFIGGVVGGSFDAAMTRGIGGAAKALFSPGTRESEG